MKGGIRFVLDRTIRSLKVWLQIKVGPNVSE